MKITKSHLKQLIKEELEALLKEQPFKKGSTGYGKRGIPSAAAEVAFGYTARRAKQRHEKCFVKCSSNPKAHAQWAPKACMDFCRRLSKKDFKSFRESESGWGGHGTDTVIWPGHWDDRPRVHKWEVFNRRVHGRSGIEDMHKTLRGWFGI